MKTTAFVIYSILFLAVADHLQAQNYIGMHKDQIIETMKETEKQLKLNTSTVNPHYNYLKYEDKINEITVLFFLSEDDMCTLVRKMCDYSNINEVVNELDEKYNSAGMNKWYYKENGQRYIVELTEEDWFFTVTTRMDK